MTELPTVVIADDHPLFRKGLVEVLDEDGSFRIAGEAEDGETALAVIRRLRPAIALLDIEMPGMSGLAVAEALHQEELGVAVVILTMYSEAGVFRRALDLGVMGYVLKDSAVTEIVACLHMVTSGRPYISPALSGELLERSADTPVAELAALEELTPAEHRVLQLVAAGLTSAEIAENLGNSPKTIENHRSHICGKLGLTGPQALLRFALENRSLIE
ncbi:MAG: response regulator [Candidatus Longimicrobiales bacterium M2_2A_002]